MKVAIVGAGAMGSGIAQIVASAGQEVKVYDKSPSALDRSRRQLEKRLSDFQKKGRLTNTEAQMIQTKISYTSALAELSEAKLVIESIIEELATKQRLFQELEDIVDENCILGTNTSSLSITAIAAACRKKPGRVVGIHFFIPADQVNLVEIIPALQTRSPITRQVEQIIQQWGKTTVLVKDRPGFLVNRIARPYYLEALRILEEGIADIATIDWAMTHLGGFKIGPFALMDYIGNDVNYDFTRQLFESTHYDTRYQPSIAQKRLVEAGYLGRKTGKGFYNYFDHSTNPAPRQDETLGKQILIRILVLLINEAADALFHQYATKEDIDLAMSTGIDFPYGLLSWADDLGIGFVVRQIDELYNTYHEDRYRCSPLLRLMQKRAERFYE